MLAGEEPCLQKNSVLHKNLLWEYDKMTITVIFDGNFAANVTSLN
jgi:hypothetical protein